MENNPCTFSEMHFAEEVLYFQNVIVQPVETKGAAILFRHVMNLLVSVAHCTQVNIAYLYSTMTYDGKICEHFLSKTI